jgi:hypothetical protein
LLLLFLFFGFLELDFVENVSNKGYQKVGIFYHRGIPNCCG